MSRGPNPTDGADSVCPKCGKTGRQVSEVTIEALVSKAQRQRLQRGSGFRFCPNRLSFSTEVAMNPNITSPAQIDS